jgi:short-subunit dehydrogenase
MKIAWQQQTVVLTGAYGGLGKALACCLNDLGARLILVGRNEDKLNELTKQLSAEVITVVGDVSEPSTSEKLNDLLKNQQSAQHMLINNAALSHAGFLQQQSAAQLKQMIDINLLAPMLMTQQLLPWLKQAKQAQIINVGSSFGGIGYPGFSGYCASKFGLRGFTQALNRELSDSQVKAFYLAPRAMSTGINSTQVNELNAQLGNAIDDPSEIAKQIIKAIEKNQTEKFFGWPEKLFVRINALLPSVVSKAIKKDHSAIQTLLNNEVKP